MRKRAFCILVITAYFVAGFNGSMAEEIVRKTAVAGSWYPGEREELKDTVDSLLKNAKKASLQGDLIALIAPHAGFAFSAPIAAEAFKQIEGADFKTVILIGPTHRYDFSGISIFDRGYFETPLGKIKINESLAKSLVSDSELIKPLPEAHQDEHCLEIELPFLQRALKEFEIVPLLTGELSYSDFSKVGKTIAKYFTLGKTLLVVSSDMSHYPRYDDAIRVDNKTLESIRTLDPRNILSTSKSLLEERTPGLSCTVCGESAILIATCAARELKANRVTILKYSNSGDSHPAGWSDKSRVVGYGAVAIHRFPSMSKEAQEKLLKLSRKAIATYMETRKVPSFLEEKDMEPALSEELSQKLGIFVTLRDGKRLRGCIGRVEQPESLLTMIGQLACSAAFGDPRFPPLTKQELDRITIEVTVCSPLQRIEDHREIIPYLHGVVVKRNGNSGLYLPSVWDETGWSKEEFMGSLCEGKAGLPQDAWKQEGTSIYIFTGHRFSE